MTVLPFGRFGRLLLCALFALGLTACDSSSDDDGDGQGAGFPGDPDMLGMWEMLDETTGEPFDSDYQFFLDISHAANAVTFRVWEWDAEVGACWTTETSETASSNVTATTVSGGEFGTTPRRYTADANRLAFYDDGVADPDILFRRSTRSASSFTPLCP